MCTGSLTDLHELLQQSFTAASTGITIVCCSKSYEI